MQKSNQLEYASFMCSVFIIRDCTSNPSSKCQYSNITSRPSAGILNPNWARLSVHITSPWSPTNMSDQMEVSKNQAKPDLLKKWDVSDKDPEIGPRIYRNSQMNVAGEGTTYSAQTLEEHSK